MSAKRRSPPNRPPLSVPAVLLCALCSTACAPAPERPVIVNRVTPAELVRPCPDEPPLPAAFADDREQAGWLDRALEAGAECRAAHRALSTWATEPPANRFTPHVNGEVPASYGGGGVIGFGTD